MVQKDLTQLFTGIFFFVSLIYFTIMFLVLKDDKISNYNLEKSTDKKTSSLDYLF